jgi:short subunit dehydrogenase-like uncharacterized protein
MTNGRHDLVVFGATGFTGELLALSLARRLSPGRHTWALAGRDLEKLRRVREQVIEIEPRWADLPLYQADTADRASLAALAARARVLVTTVGPYAEHGEPVVQACVEAGTDYLDLTGEPAYWRSIVRTYHERAKAAKVLIVPCCGFDSMPADLGVYLAMRELKASGPVEVDAYVAAVGRFSGGTWASALGIMADLGAQERSAGSSEARGPKRRVHMSDHVDAWVVPMPVIDPLVVRRSAELLGDTYGGSLRYTQWLRTKSLRQLVGIVAGAGVLLGLAKVGAKIEPVGSWLRSLRPSGSGPSEERRSRSWFRVDVFARGDGRAVHTRVSGGDPGYTETVKMLGEAALCLVEDRAALPFRGGVLTPASAMGDRLVERLRAQGLELDVVAEAAAGVAAAG